jgi:hypothetical protein
MNQRGTKNSFLFLSAPIFRKALLWLAIILLVVVQGAFSARAIIYTTPIIGVRESSTMFTWGDGTHVLGETWSVDVPTSSGWVYGSSYGFNVDVYDAGAINALSVADASGFAYATGYLHFGTGDAVFFRGVGGYYGAWQVTAVYPSGGAAFLNGTGFFQSDGSANFTSVPEPSAWEMLAMGTIALGGFRRSHLNKTRRCCNH